MTNAEQAIEKTRYICQTYIEKKAGRDGQAGLEIAKRFEYTAKTINRT